MNELTSLGLILLLALLAGHLVKVVRVPEVTGYIIAGVILGPSVLGWLSHENLLAIGLFSEVALGLILFSVGSVFEISLFRRLGRQIALVTLIESTLAAAVVTIGILALGQPWQVAALLGAIAIATAPASTLMVVRECDSAGPLTDNLLGIIALNNLFCITVYSLVAAAIEMTAQTGATGATATALRSGFTLVWQLLGSAALGYLVGLLLAVWSSQVSESGEMLILLAGSILLCVGAARWLELSALVASLAVGATMVNLSHRSQHLFETLSGTDPPFYVIFFVLAGAELDVTLVSAIGPLGVVYLGGRAGGKFLGARIGARWLGLESSVQRYLGFALLAQAGLAVGLTLAVNARFETWAHVVSTVVLGSVAVYEVVGPTSTRFALGRAGEIGRRAKSGAPTVSAERPANAEAS
jgi:Kef-type K+ transport system membrane component KefB